MSKKEIVRILHIIPSLGSGGAERLLTDIVVDTSDSGIRHIVCVLGRADFFAERIKKGGGQVIELGLKGRRPWLKAAWRIRKIARESRVNLMVSWLYDASVSMRLASIPSLGIRLITTLHAPDYDPETVKAGQWPPVKIEILRWIDKITAKISRSEFVACSHFVADSYIRHLGVKPSNIRVIHNFVVPGLLKRGSGDSDRVRESLGIPANAFLYSNVGRLDPQKGQIHLLKAFVRIVNEVPNAYLLIVGEGPLLGDLKNLALQMKVGDRVVFAGRREDIGGCLEATNVFVFPALFEGFGIALVEAMAQGLPCIVSKLQVLEEIVENEVSGIFVDPKSESAISKAMARLYWEPKTRQSLGKNASTRVNTLFSSRVIIPEWERLFVNNSDSTLHRI